MKHKTFFVNPETELKCKFQTANYLFTVEKRT